MRKFLGILCVVIMAGCGDRADVTAPSTIASSANLSASSAGNDSQRIADELHDLARCVALAMRDPEIRRELRDAWRGSRQSTDRKLFLNEFLSSEEGATVRSRIAEAARVSDDGLLQTIGRLPKLDFYVPFETHRSTWRATDDIVVGVAIDFDAPSIKAYDVRGSLHSLELATARQGNPLVIIHAAEPRPVQRAPIADGSAEVIDDRRTEGSISAQNLTGGVVLASVQTDDPCEDPAAIINCEGGGSGGGGGSPPPPPSPGVYLTAFYSYRNDGWAGDLEMQIRSFVYEGNATYNGNSNWSFT